jgi:hypothetical protein
VVDEKDIQAAAQGLRVNAEIVPALVACYVDMLGFHDSDRVSALRS